MTFKNRQDAGIQIAQRLQKHKNAKNTLVIALPRGGVVNGYEIAKSLNLPLDIIISKKIPFPNNPEVAIGSISQDGHATIDEVFVSTYGIPKEYINTQKKEILVKIQEKLKYLKNTDDIVDLSQTTIILVDDGMATGYTMKEAVSYLKRHKAKKIIIAVPVSPKDVLDELSEEVNEVICLDDSFLFGAIGAYYDDFTQVTDEEAKKYIDELKQST